MGWLSCATEAIARHACSLSSGSLETRSALKYLSRISPCESVPVAYLLEVRLGGRGEGRGEGGGEGRGEEGQGEGRGEEGEGEGEGWGWRSWWRGWRCARRAG